MPVPRDPGLDRILDLNGEVLVVSTDGEYWVEFEVHEVEVSVSKPHRLKYSLTLHGPGNKRLVGFDNAHPVSPTTWDAPHDHRRRASRSVWAEVDKMLKSFGVQ